MEQCTFDRNRERMGFFCRARGESSRRCSFQGRVGEYRKLYDYGANGLDVTVKAEVCGTVFRWPCRPTLEKVLPGKPGALEGRQPVLKSGLL